MKKAMFVISVLSAGGAARVLSILANHFAKQDDMEVSVVSHVFGSGYDLDEKIDWRALYSPEEMRTSVCNKIWRRIVYWPRLFFLLSKSRPDTVVVFLRGMNWRLILLCRLLGINVIATEHTNHLAETGFLSWIERRLIYKLADALVVLTEFDRSYYSKFLKNVHLIPNPLSFPVVNDELLRDKTILAVGDLNRWQIKGFDTLIEVFSQLALRFPDWTLRIVGPGESGRRHLLELVASKGLNGRVDMPGFIKAVDVQMAKSEIFVLSSRYEGFSMVLLEAMSKGCACLSFDCPSGPGDLLRGGEAGLLVPHQDATALRDGLARLLSSRVMRAELSDRAVAAAQSYGMERLEPRWRSIL